MLQFEADSKTRSYFGGDIPTTPVGLLEFSTQKNANIEGRRVCDMIKIAESM